MNNPTNNYWTDDRLDRLANAVDGLKERQETTTVNIEALRERQETTTVNIEALRERQETTTANIEALKEQQKTTTANIEALRGQQEATNTNIDILVGLAAGHQERFTALLEEIRKITVEIRGLQTENRRILDHLFGQDGK